jgi:RNA polymerase sigma-70 factor (ECF subfamily)
MAKPMRTRTQTIDGPEASLLAMARTGNQLAVDQLVRMYWPQAYRVAVRILRSHEDAEDAAQDALMAAITHLSSFREDASFRTWLHRIVVNHSLMELRRKHSTALGSPCELFADAPPSYLKGPRTPEELLLEAECRTVIDEGLSRVPAFYSAAVRLADREGKSTSEIADSMGISKGAVKTRLHRGRAHLRREVLRRLCLKSAVRPAFGKALQRGRANAESLAAA